MVPVWELKISITRTVTREQLGWIQERLEEFATRAEASTVFEIQGAVVRVITEVTDPVHLHMLMWHFLADGYSKPTGLHLTQYRTSPLKERG